MADAAVTGVWRGSLVDVLGAEGTLTLQLTGRGDAVRGEFTARITGQHEPLVRTGTVAGSATGGRVALNLTFPRGEGDEVRIALEGHAFDLVDSGAGLCGVYEVAARSFSPLQGGVVALSRDRRVQTAEVRGGRR